MAILIDETKRVLVQGITGREGQARTRLMREYGTNVVAGVTPGKGGQTVLRVPVFNKPEEAVKTMGKIDISVLFVPAAGVKDAAIVEPVPAVLPADTSVEQTQASPLSLPAELRLKRRRHPSAASVVGAAVAASRWLPC